MTLAQALRQALAGGVSRLDGHLLMLHALRRPGSDRAWLLAHDDHELTAQQAELFEGLCRRRAAGEPVAYLTGCKEFFGLPLAVDPRVLVPRPETETLVEWALETLGGTDRPRLIDLGTGSGAIALALASRRPDARVEAVDASAGALEVARANAQRLRLEVGFRQGHWLQGCTGPYDLIASNPPYVREGDEHLAALVHEPLAALAAGPDGLDDLRQIVATAPARLAPGGWLLLEHGWDQAEAVRALLQDAGFVAVGTRQDLAGIGRCSGGRRPERG
ncbi:peptide chain release factor N(5)-glutamine methyltransferase [Ramlibacter tataouinensis]|uniref:peptide chain release factor N(5)-glutamine methyltransferase n=1 Tax=Ramlibacter tataouinensis TaxID=94132 RepID=UPI0022F3F2DA|nr:peptide chain release factor N(5)-glutamine methyltransferase [Ramlibacter tataouinensis]WBY00847.1 peptide chain release factor N(5)-glutamine methyltransferase [Ramlibacter tataouinensis]